jgi:hypothetical protein
MSQQVANTVTLSGDHLNRISQLLGLARRYARAAGDGYNINVQDALAELDDELGERIAALHRAEQDDRAMAEETGEAEQVRQAYFSHYRAA